MAGFCETSGIPLRYSAPLFRSAIPLRYSASNGLYASDVAMANRLKCVRAEGPDMLHRSQGVAD